MVNKISQAQIVHNLIYMCNLKEFISKKIKLECWVQGGRKYGRTGKGKKVDLLLLGKKKPWCSVA